MRGSRASTAGSSGSVVWALTLGAAALLASGCQGERGVPHRGWEAVVDTLGDTVVVHTVAGSVWGDTATLVAEVSIGRFDGPDEYVIGDPRSIAVGPDGTILVLDGQVPVVRAYGPDGAYLRDIGRQGRGPGEYDGPDGMAVLPDGRILVRDPGNSRISVFDLQGNLLDAWSHPGGFNTDRRFYVDAAGNSYTTVLLERGVVPWKWRFGLARYGATGRVSDTLSAPVWEFERAQVTASREGSSSVRSVPFTPQVAWTFSPLGYFVGGLSDAYRIDLRRTDVPTVRIEKDQAPVPVQQAEGDEQRRRITEGLRRQYGAWRWDGPSVPDVKPPFKELFTSAEGDVWVVLSTVGVPTISEAEAEREFRESGLTPIRFREPVALDVFDPDGRYLGPVSVPSSFRVEPEPVVRGDYVWAVTRDELDVATVNRFRIVR